MRITESQLRAIVREVNEQTQLSETEIDRFLFSLYINVQIVYETRYVLSLGSRIRPPIQVGTPTPRQKIDISRFARQVYHNMNGNDITLGKMKILAEMPSKEVLDRLNRIARGTKVSKDLLLKVLRAVREGVLDAQS